MRKLIRRGECNRCGKCCEGCANFIPPNICSVWDELPLDRGCRVWPLHPYEVPPYCSFHFYDAETGEEVRAYKDAKSLEIYEAVRHGD